MKGTVWGWRVSAAARQPVLLSGDSQPDCGEAKKHFIPDRAWQLLCFEQSPIMAFHAIDLGSDSLPSHLDIPDWSHKTMA
jgi:hypothetical protein